MTNAFAVFIDDGQGPVWRGFFDDLEEAKQKAQELAKTEHREFFVFHLEEHCEVARFFPTSRQPEPHSA